MTKKKRLGLILVAPMVSLFLTAFVVAIIELGWEALAAILVITLAIIGINLLLHPDENL